MVVSPRLKGLFFETAVFSFTGLLLMCRGHVKSPWQGAV